MVLDLPIRDGNIIPTTPSSLAPIVLDLPIRDGNTNAGGKKIVLVSGFRPSYKGWKHEIINLAPKVLIGFRPSYKGWKH